MKNEHKVKENAWKNGFSPHPENRLTRMTNSNMSYKGTSFVFLEITYALMLYMPPIFFC